MDEYEVIIIGGSFAGLSAAMALGRSQRNTLVVDNGMPCNIQTPHSHNFLTQDGVPPLEILNQSKEQVSRYPSVSFKKQTVVNALKTEKGFEIRLEDETVVMAQKLLLAYGIKDDLSQIPGLAACWGISVIHCPYCHGYEVKGRPTAIIANGDDAVHLAKLVRNLTDDVILLTNGPATVEYEARKLLERKNIRIREDMISEMIQDRGKLQEIRFENDESLKIGVAYYRAPFTQKSEAGKSLGCDFTPTGLLSVTPFQQTTVPGVYAAGDNSSPMRSVAYAVATGSIAGAMLNHELTEENF